MKLPPNASSGSGHPRVWITALSGFGVCQTSFTPEREDLRIGRADLLPLAPALAQQPPRPLGDHRHLRGDIGRLAIIGRRLAIAVETGRGGADAAHRVALHQQRVHRKPGEQVDARLLRPLAHPTHDLADGCRVEPGVVHGGRGGNALSAALGHEVHRFARDGLAERDVAGVEVGKELVEGARVHHGAGEIVLAQRTRLFQHGDVELAETAARLRVLLRQPGQLDGAGQPGGPCPDDRDIHLDRLGARRIAADDLIERQRTLVSGGDDGGHVGQLLGKGSDVEAAEI